jgi:hypothetical protein
VTFSSDWLPATVLMPIKLSFGLYAVEINRRRKGGGEMEKQQERERGKIKF